MRNVEIDGNGKMVNLRCNQEVFENEKALYFHTHPNVASGAQKEMTVEELLKGA